MFAWGDAAYGKLGINEMRTTIEVPKKVTYFEGKFVSRIRIGSQLSAIVTSNEDEWLVNKVLS